MQSDAQQVGEGSEHLPLGRLVTQGVCLGRSIPHCAELAGTSRGGGRAGLTAGASSPGKRRDPSVLAVVLTICKRKQGNERLKEGKRFIIPIPFPLSAYKQESPDSPCSSVLFPLTQQG